MEVLNSKFSFKKGQDYNSKISGRVSKFNQVIENKIDPILNLYHATQEKPKENINNLDAELGLSFNSNVNILKAQNDTRKENKNRKHYEHDMNIGYISNVNAAFNSRFEKTVTKTSNPSSEINKNCNSPRKCYQDRHSNINPILIPNKFANSHQKKELHVKENQNSNPFESGDLGQEEYSKVKVVDSKSTQSESKDILDLRNITDQDLQTNPFFNSISKKEKLRISKKTSLTESFNLSENKKKCFIKGKRSLPFDFNGIKKVDKFYLLSTCHTLSFLFGGIIGRLTEEYDPCIFLLVLIIAFIYFWLQISSRIDEDKKQIANGLIIMMSEGFLLRFYLMGLDYVTLVKFFVFSTTLIYLMIWSSIYYGRVNLKTWLLVLLSLILAEIVLISFVSKYLWNKLMQFLIHSIALVLIAMHIMAMAQQLSKQAKFKILDNSNECMILNYSNSFIIFYVLIISMCK